MKTFEASPVRLFRFLLGCAKEIRHARLVFLIVIAASIISGVSNTVLLALINDALSRPGAADELILGFAGLCLLLPSSRLISEILLNRLTAAAVFELRMTLSRRILASPLRLLEQLGAHRLMAALTDDIPTIAGAMADVPLLFVHAAIVVGCLVYLGWLSLTVLAAVVAFIIVGVISYQVPVLRAGRFFGQARESWDQLFKHFRALTDGAKELKLHRPRRAAFLSKLLVPTASTLRCHNVTATTIYAAARSWGQVLVFVLIGLLVFGLPKIQSIDSKTITGYCLILLYVATPIEVILNMFPLLTRANVAVRKIEDLGLSLAADSGSGSLQEAEPKSSWERLELVGVTHSYYREGEGDNFTLGPIDLILTRGEMVFVAGGNGSGKTTLAKILAGLYAPESGNIQIDGRPVTDGTRDDYRQYFSAIFSDFFLFDSLLGLNVSDLDFAAREHLTRLQLAHKVRIADGTLSTTELSQGQRKRLALLTAYLEDRPTYIFDEWAADQDPLFRDIFYLQLLPELKARGKTVVVITHDDRYYDLADRLVKLEYGKIVLDKPVSELQNVSFFNSRRA
jgi:putative ATP-binding cassette transporter